MKLVLAFVLGSLVLTGVAHADPQRPQRPMRQALLERFDRDHDGRLDPRERRAAVRQLRKLAKQLARHDRGKARMHAIVGRYDLNGDGDLGPGEVPPAVAKRLRRLDRNGDGWVDESELRR